MIMKVLDPNVIVGSSGLASVVENENGVRITLKNKSTLDISAEVDENGVFTGFAYEYLTAQQNKKINSLKEKMAKLQNEMQGIITSEPVETEETEETETEDDAEDITD